MDSLGRQLPYCNREFNNMCTDCTQVGQAAPLRSRFHAWFLDANEATMHKMYGGYKQTLFQDLKGTVVEVGPGAGANLRYYPAGQRLVAVEPNQAMHTRLQARAAEHGIELDIRRLHGESLDLPDNSADVVVATLLLCSVSDPEKVIAEIRRILKPGGRYVFIEHVADDRAGVVQFAQSVMHRPHQWVFEGCQTKRRTWETLEAAGFAKLDYARKRISSPLFWVTPHIVGAATK